ncbi:MAG TPA: ATP-binding protein [Candidatus Mediterraneibacter excrementigallinarum]|nr:ATP-binding protein [Candidatus Mediterraneibacter excrementigallinarum]
MARTAAIGHQDYETVRMNDYFYVDKTGFIKEWWDSGDIVTLITRPRRFGKTLNLSMTEKFFSTEYAGRKDLFEGMQIWDDDRFRALQGSYPVIFLTFAGLKDSTYLSAREHFCRTIEEIYNRYEYLTEGTLLNEKEKEYYRSVKADMDDSTAAVSLRNLSDYLCRYFGKKTIILLDEYDTPMQEAYVNRYWDEIVDFTRNLLNNTFKTNPYLERALMTGITRVSRESVFSDLNNLRIVTTTTEKYETSFGFTEEEVAASLREFGLADRADEVKQWYDGFTFGSTEDIYNPWSILNFLKEGKTAPYWANTSSNSLVGKLIREGNGKVKEEFQMLLEGGAVRSEIDEQIVYDQLDMDESAIWSLLLASGYLAVKKVETIQSGYGDWKQVYTLKLTDFEVQVMFRRMVRNWFAPAASSYNGFLCAFLEGDVEAMNVFINRVARGTFSFFDTAGDPEHAEPEKFYHGFVLGMMVELSDKYRLTSNRESGFGRYDIMLMPYRDDLDAAVMEFKVFNPRKEKTLEDTAENALKQIEEKEYVTELEENGIPAERIRKYGFAFRGKEVLICCNRTAGSGKE